MTHKKVNYNPRVVLKRLVARNNRVVEQQSSERASNSSNANSSTLAESMADNLPSTANEQRALQITPEHPTVRIVPNDTHETDGNQSDVTLINFNILEILDDSTATISNAQPRNNRNLIMVLLDISTPNHPTIDPLNSSHNETTETIESIDSKDNVLTTPHVSESMEALNNVSQSLSTSVEKNKSFETTPDSPIVISSDSDSDSEGSDVKCSHNFNVTQIATKEEIISDVTPTEQTDVPVIVATNRLDGSGTMETEAESLVDNQLVEGRQISTSDESKNDHATEEVVYVVGEPQQNFVSIECNHGNSEPVENATNNDTIEGANDTVGQLEYESSNASDDTIDWIVNGGPSEKKKTTSFDSSVDHRTVISEAVEANKQPDTIENSVNEMHHDNVRTKNYLAVVPYQALLNDAPADTKLNNGHSDVESDDSFGLVIDEHYESNSVNADNATLHVSDNESIRDCENVVETDDDPVLIANEVDAISSINLDDSLSIPNDDENVTEDGTKCAVQSSGTTNIFDKLHRNTKKKSVRESMSVSDDEIVTSGRYGGQAAQVKCEDESKLVTSFSLRLENIRSTGTEISKTSEVIVDEVVEKENLPDAEEHNRSTMDRQSDDDHLTVDQLNMRENQHIVDYSDSDSSEGPADNDDKLMLRMKRKRKHSSITQCDSITIPAKRRKCSTTTTADDTESESDRPDDQQVNERKQRKSTQQQEKSKPKVIGKVRGFFRKLTSNLREKRNQLKAKIFHKKNCAPRTQGTSAGNFIITNFREESVNGFRVAPANRVFKDEPM